MARLGMSKPVVHTKAFEESVAHKHVPGRAYDIQDPATKLIHMIGGGLFNEPRYYDSNRKYADFLNELATDGKISSRITDDKGLTEQAASVLKAMVDVANSDNPEDLLIIAAWARDKENGLKLRTTPQMAVVMAATNPATQPFVRRYARKIMCRVDEVRQVFAAFRHLFQNTGKTLHKGSLPHSMRKAICDVLANTSDYELLKYNSDEKPTLKDVLLMVSGSKKNPRLHKDGYPLRKAMFEYLVNGKISDGVPEMIKARDAFFKTPSFDQLDLSLLSKAGLTWENITSKFGSKKEVWELCTTLMGETALIKNLRNFEEAGISQKAWDLVQAKLLNVKNSELMPFQLYAASKMVTSKNSKTILDNHADISCAKVPELSGVTVVLVDNSGSAQGTALSKDSILKVSDAGNMLGAIAASRFGIRCLVGVFGDSLVWVPTTSKDTCLDIKNRIDEYATKDERSTHGALAIPEYKRGQGVGGGTETGLWWAIDDLTKRNIKVDRIIICSDICCYTQGDVNCCVNMTKYFGKNASMQGMIDRYKHSVNPDCFVYSVNLAGYEQSQLRENDKRAHLLSGYSEKLFNLIADLEAADTKTQSSVPIPTINVLREKYGVTTPKV